MRFLNETRQLTHLLFFPRDGIDGAWSTFSLQIGTPPQSVRLLPSITGNTIWAVLTQACQDASSNTCRSDRGETFATNGSSTWEERGAFYLPLDPEHYLPFSGTANFGFDNVTLEWPDHDGITLQDQVIASYITEDFYVGALGVSPVSVQVSSLNDQHSSFLATLREKGHTPSFSYGYTAGASYRSFPVHYFGSLTFGGVDSTRFDASQNLTITGGSDTYRPMLLGVEEITSDSMELLEEPIIVALDSIVSHIWLPISACRRFESVFGLVWNERHQLYIVNETQHSDLITKNASITFTLSAGSDRSMNDKIEIMLPYAAFDLTAKPPFSGLNETVHYFPLKRAANSTQYTLGRVILQEVYMIADYERGALSLFPARFPNVDVEPHLVAIYPPGYAPMNTAGNPRNGLSRTAIIGIAIGSTALMISAAGGVLYIQRNKRQKREKAKRAAAQVQSQWVKPELVGDQMMYSTELDGQELAASPAFRTGRGSLTSPSRISISPMKAELCASGQINEMP